MKNGWTLISPTPLTPNLSSIYIKFKLESVTNLRIKSIAAGLNFES